jgi:hypothetical protein
MSPAAQIPSALVRSCSIDQDAALGCRPAFSARETSTHADSEDDELGSIRLSSFRTTASSRICATVFRDGTGRPSPREGLGRRG